MYSLKLFTIPSDHQLIQVHCHPVLSLSSGSCHWTAVRRARVFQIWVEHYGRVTGPHLRGGHPHDHRLRTGLKDIRHLAGLPFGPSTAAPQGHQQGARLKAGGPNTPVFPQAHRKHRPHLLHILHHLRYSRRSGTYPHPQTFCPPNLISQ